MKKIILSLVFILTFATVASAEIWTFKNMNIDQTKQFIRKQLSIATKNNYFERNMQVFENDATTWDEQNMIQIDCHCKIMSGMFVAKDYVIRFQLDFRERGTDTQVRARLLQPRLVTKGTVESTGTAVGVGRRGLVAVGTTSSEINETEVLEMPFKLNSRMTAEDIMIRSISRFAYRFVKAYTEEGLADGLPNADAWITEHSNGSE